MSDKDLTSLERSLMALSPASGLSRDHLLFAMGQESVRGQPGGQSGRANWWKAGCLASSALCGVLTVFVALTNHGETLPSRGGIDPSAVADKLPPINSLPTHDASPSDRADHSLASGKEPGATKLQTTKLQTLANYVDAQSARGGHSLLSQRDMILALGVDALGTSEIRSSPLTRNPRNRSNLDADLGPFERRAQTDQDAGSDEEQPSGLPSLLQRLFRNL